MVTLNGVKIVIEVDNNPDLSHLGVYSDDGSAPGSIDRQERGDMGHGEYRYFAPANPEYAEADYARYEAYNRDDWQMVGLWAEAELIVGPGPKAGLAQTIRSGGLWGIESDSGRDFFEETAEEELARLRGQLRELGVPLDMFEAMAERAIDEMGV